MTRSSRGRSTTGEAAVPYYRGSDVREAAKHLRLTVTRYLADRASLADINGAVVEFQRAVPVSSHTALVMALDELLRARSAKT